MLVLYLGYYVSATSFYHIHYYKGEIIAHSHFYCLHAFGGASATEHQHTPAQFQAIAFLTDIILACVSGFSIFFIFACTRKLYTFFRQAVVYIRLLTRRLRAPTRFAPEACSMPFRLIHAGA